eukprot:1433990-Pyramimonas_sp.AAC.1
MGATWTFKAQEYPWASPSCTSQRPDQLRSRCVKFSSRRARHGEPFAKPVALAPPPPHCPAN